MNNTLLKLENLTITPPGANKTILSNINYQFESGDFIILLGNNGSGKSSLIKAINRTYNINSGKALLENKDIKNFKNKVFCKKVITLTQNYSESLFDSLTILENCLIAKQRQNKAFLCLSDKKERIFFKAYLQNFNSTLSNNLDLVVNNLSGGEKQSFALALSVLYPPQLLLLDEHTSALDPKAAKRIMELTNQVINKYNITCLLTTHNLDIALNYGNKILVLNDGQISRDIDKHGKKSIDLAELLTLY